MVHRKDDQSAVLRAFVGFARRFFSQKRIDGAQARRDDGDHPRDPVR
jgi:hypothetical protein